MDHTSTVKPTSFWRKIVVSCDCAEDERQKCRQKYVSASVCGDSWRMIEEDTVSFQTLAAFILLGANCNANGVLFKAVKDSLEYVFG